MCVFLYPCEVVNCRQVGTLWLQAGAATPILFVHRDMDRNICMAKLFGSVWERGVLIKAHIEMRNTIQGTNKYFPSVKAAPT